MRHVLDIGKYAHRWVKHGRLLIPVKGIILQGAAIDKWTPIGEDDHAIAEHVPRDSLSDERICLRIPHSTLIILVRSHVPGTRDDKYFAGVHQCHMNWIDRH